MNPAVFRRLDQVQLYSLVLFALWASFSIAVSHILYGISLACVLALIVSGQYRLAPGPLRLVYLSIMAYVAWMFVASAFGPTPLHSFWILKEDWLFLMIPVAVYAFRDGRRADLIILWLAAGVVIVSVYGVVQHYTGVYWFKPHGLGRIDAETLRLSGFFSHPLTFGNYMATVSLFLIAYAVTSYRRFEGWKRWLLITAASLAPIVTAVSNSRGPVLALMASIAIAGILLKKKRYVVVVLAVIFGAGSLASPGIVTRFSEKFEVDTKLRYEGGRLFIWNNSVKVIRDRPLFGTGQGNFSYAYATYIRPDAPDYRKVAHAHNDLLNTAGIAGIPGALLYLFFWGVIMRLLWRGYRRKAFSDQQRALCLAALLASVCFFLSGFTEATFADEEVRVMLMFCWGAGLAQWYKEYDSGEPGATLAG